MTYWAYVLSKFIVSFRTFSFDFNLGVVCPTLNTGFSYSQLTDDVVCSCILNLFWFTEYCTVSFIRPMLIFKNLYPF